MSLHTNVSFRISQNSINDTSAYPINKTIGHDDSNQKIIAMNWENNTEFVITWHEKRARSYWKYVPTTYDNQSQMPLVIILHGGGESAVSMIQKTQFCEEAEKSGFIAVFPNGISRIISPFWRTWNTGYCCGIALIRNVNDVGYINSIINQITNAYHINQNMIYVTGHSNGAILTYLIGATLSEKIAAIAPVAGAIGGKICERAPLWTIPEPSQPISVVAFHGRLDENVPYDGGDGNRSWGPSIDMSVNQSISFWVKQNRCDTIPISESSETGNIIIDSYKNGENNSEVVLYTIKNGGHGWPGSSVGDRPTNEISATNIIWDFFESHPKNR